MPSKDNNLPSDYEPCGDCGYDHGYEYSEAHSAHLGLALERDLFLNQTIPSDTFPSDLE